MGKETTLPVKQRVGFEPGTFGRPLTTLPQWHSIVIEKYIECEIVNGDLWYSIAIAVCECKTHNHNIAQKGYINFLSCWIYPDPAAGQASVPSLTGLER